MMPIFSDIPPCWHHVMILQTGSGSTIYYTQDNSNQHTIRSMSFHTSTLQVQRQNLEMGISEDMLQTSEDPKQSTDNTTKAKIGDGKGEITAIKLLTQQTERGRYREVKSFSSLFTASDTLQEIVYVQLDDLTTKDVFLSSIIKWAFSTKDKGQPKTPSKHTFDFIFCMKCDQESLYRDIHSAIQSNLYSNVPALQDLAKHAMVNGKYKCLLVIDVPEELNLELNVAL